MLKYFGLLEKPFNITANPRFFFLTSTHKEAVFKVEWVVKDRQGMTAVFGDAGTGKTTLARTLVDRLSEDNEVVFITNPDYPSDMVMAVALSHMLGVTPKRSCELQKQALNIAIGERFAAGKPVVFILDEGQLLTMKSLEFLRQLSNLETDDEKLCQIIILGQPELRNRINKKKALKRRIFAPHTLNPLTLDDMISLIMFRISVAGGSPELFDLDALENIYRKSEGSVWSAMKICSFCLQVAFNNKKRVITSQIVDTASSVEV